MLSVPIKCHNNVLGVININNKRNGGVFTPNDLRFVATLSSQASIAIENVRIFEELKETHFEAIVALAEVLEAKDSTTGRHSHRLLQYAMKMADRLGLNEDKKEQLRYVAVLHDIGKIGISKEILQKPGDLTRDEYHSIKKHPHLGAEFVQKIRFLSNLAPLIYSHHERNDGRGYPQGLSGEEIPIVARIVAVLDAYDAMTSDRPYRGAMKKELAVQELKKHAGSQFDSTVVEKFLLVLEEHENVIGKFNNNRPMRMFHRSVVN